jgi:hypothetical protein
MQEGLEQGVLKGQRELLLRLLRRRFGALPDEVVAWVQAGDARSLERWGDDVIGAHSLEEIFFDEFAASR